jgi:hypothetical protein
MSVTATSNFENVKHRTREPRLKQKAARTSTDWRKRVIGPVKAAWLFGTPVRPSRMRLYTSYWPVSGIAQNRVLG